MKVRDFQHSRPLDVHLWSDHQEVNRFVGALFDKFLKKKIKENTSIKKKHLKLIILDLYVAWFNDPELNISVHMTQSAYSDGTVFNKGKSRYNELNVKVSTIDIVHRLRDMCLIGYKEGWQDIGGRGFVTRIWPSEKLITMFENAAFGYFDIGYSDGRETIILRDENKNNVEYEDKIYIKQMRLLVQAYNKLLEKTFIDIQSVDEPARIELPAKNERRFINKPVFVNIAHHDKFVRRIFNNKTFSDGGRFYGGWWQRIDSKCRADIQMNSLPTVEIDYSALHVILAYSEAGIDYWQTNLKDSYDVPVRGEDNPERRRDIAKLFLLLSLNASDEQALYKAFRSELESRKYPYSFPDDVLLKLLDSIKKRHPDINHMMCSGAGLRLMNIDSRICDYVIADFVRTSTPILTLHDSFIVPIGEEDRLKQLIKEAFEDVTNKLGINAKYNRNLTRTRLSVHGPRDRGWYNRMLQWMNKGNPTNGYQRRLQRHSEHFAQ